MPQSAVRLEYRTGPVFRFAVGSWSLFSQLRSHSRGVTQGLAAAEPEKPAQSVYEPQGAPADPKVPAQWNAYRDHAAATRLLEQLAAAHPSFAG